MQLLPLVQEFCRRQGISVPAVVVASTDQTILQVLGLLNEGSMTIARRKDWFSLRGRASFQHAGGAGYLAFLLSDLPDYKSFVPRTMYASDQRLPVAGPATAEDWAQMMALVIAPAMYTYRIYGGAVYIYPQPTVLSSVNFTFEYNSKNSVILGAVTKPYFTTDTDQSRLPDELLLADLRWRWKKEKNQPYAEEMRDFEAMLEAEAGAETLPGDLRMDDPDPDSRVAYPGLLIPAGSWNVP